MKKVLFVISILFSTTISSQDSIPKKINAVWVEPEVVFETKKEEVVELVKPAPVLPPTPSKPIAVLKPKPVPKPVPRL